MHPKMYYDAVKHNSHQYSLCTKQCIPDEVITDQVQYVNLIVCARLIEQRCCVSQIWPSLKSYCVRRNYWVHDYIRKFIMT